MHKNTIKANLLPVLNVGTTAAAAASAPGAGKIAATVSIN